MWYGPQTELAPTLVFLHEGLGCVELWHDFPAKVSEATGCGALVYSRQGYGKSDRCKLPLPLTFMHNEGLKILPAVIEAANIRNHILIGHSDGASISLIYAGGARVVNLLGLVVEAPHVFCEEKTVNYIRKAKNLYEKGNLKKQLRKYHGENTDCAFYGWNSVWLDPCFIDWNIEEYLLAIEPPILVIQGADDEYGTLEHMRRIQAKSNTDVQTLVLPKCGHSPHKDQQESVLSAVADYVKKLTSHSACRN